MRMILTMLPAALKTSAESWPKLQIRITQLAREGSAPPGLRLPRLTGWGRWQPSKR